MTILLYVLSVICFLDIIYNVYKFISRNKKVNVNSLSDFDKITASKVTKINSGNSVYYLRVAGPMNFDIIGAWRDDKLSQAEKCLKIIAACICDESGKGIFNPEDKESLEKIKNLPVDDQAILLTSILGFFDSKKK
jgi:hypothetical protein